MESPRVVELRKTASRSGLDYVTDGVPGISRRRAGKGWAFYRPDGMHITDPQERLRIVSLAIPPAWADVWICADPKGHIQATARDARGRKQYRYHTLYREARDHSKFRRMLEFSELLPAIRERVERDLAGPELSRRRVVHAWSKKLMINTYSLVGLKSDVDFLIWRVGPTLEPLQAMSGAVRQTAMAGYLSMPYSYLSMTKRSTYVDKLDPDHQDTRRFITPAKSKYLFVYPFVKTREWYQIPLEQRQTIMDEHIQVGSKYPSVRIHTTYSFGLDDQEFVVAFETDHPKDFLDLVQELRGTKGSVYTLRDTPIFTCVAKPFGPRAGPPWASESASA